MISARNILILIRLSALVIWAGLPAIAPAATCTVVGPLHGQMAAVTLDGQPYVAVAKKGFSNSTIIASNWNRPSAKPKPN